MTDFDDFLRCPASGHLLCRTTDGAMMTEENRSYPVMADVPWLFPGPTAARGQWLQRISAYVGDLDQKIQQVRMELAARHPKIVTERLTALGSAYQNNQKVVGELVKPLLQQPLANTAEAAGLDYKIAPSQQVMSYGGNLFRDWCWGESELSAVNEVINGLLPPGWQPKSVLTVGAGCGRSGADMHCAWGPEVSVLFDVNPVLTMLSRTVIQGNVLHVYEFPLVPLEAKDVAVERQLQRPSAMANHDLTGLRWVLGDFTAPPFKPQSFDCIVTPWFLDIFGQDVRVTMALINSLLAPGGYWLNYGSTAFTATQFSACYSYDELLAMARQKKFTILQEVRERLPYLQSPADCHHRLEMMSFFLAQKTGDCISERLAQPVKPEWLQQTQQPIPLLPYFQKMVTSNTILLDILSRVDGKKSIEDLASYLLNQYQMPEDQARHALDGMFMKLYEEAVLANLARA